MWKEESRMTPTFVTWVAGEWPCRVLGGKTREERRVKSSARTWEVGIPRNQLSGDATRAADWADQQFR